MNRIKKIIKVIFFLSLIAFTLLSFYKPPLPEKSEIIPDVVSNEPKQEKVEEKPISKIIKGFEYKLFPRFSYELYGLVVSLYDSDNWLDYTHKEDPGNIKDICVVWGENIKNGSYKKVKFKSGEFTCFYRWEEKLDPPFSDRSGSNNHLIPANDAVTALIKKTSIGDQIHIRGYLADYSVSKNDEKLYQRTTSTTRDDKGNGACEIVYVEDFEILKEKASLYRNSKRFSFYALVSSVILIALFTFTA